MKARARKRFGQNFLHAEWVIEQLIDELHPLPGQHLVEIGPGRGALTNHLLQQCQQLDIIELDRDLVDLLRKQYQNHPQLTIHSADALRFDFTTLVSEQQPLLRLIGNLPYNISTPLLFHLLEQQQVIGDMHFMLQKEVVNRLAALPGGKQYGRLTVMVQYRCQVEPLFDVPPDAFTPEPKVMSAIVRLTPHTTPPVAVEDSTTLGKVVTQAFSQRRKTIRNTLKPLFSEQALQALEIDPGCRAETLSLADFARLSNALQ